MSRETILKAVADSQPEYLPLPDIDIFKGNNYDLEEKFTSMLTAAGGMVYHIKDLQSITKLVSGKYNGQIVSMVKGLDIGEKITPDNVHRLANTELALLEAKFAIAENGAVWLTEAEMGLRALPFICQHLAVKVSAKQIIPTMHEAYKKISDELYGFGVFIAGPSKTADIEQSLVLGAHGPRSMTVFIVK